MSMRVLAGAIAVIMFACIGAVGLFWPRQVQRSVLRYQDRTSWNPFLPFMRTEGYLAMLRIIGLMSAGAAGVFLYALLFGEP